MIERPHDATRSDTQRARQAAEALAAPLPPLIVAAELIAATVAQGVHGRRRVGTGETLWQFRRYQPGDAATLIDWRQTAKSQHIYVRERELEAAESVWLWRDSSASMRYRSAGVPEDKLASATLITVALAVLLVRAGERIAALGEDRQPRSGRAALDRLTRRLVSAREDAAVRAASLPGYERLPRYAQIVMISDLLTPLGAIEALIQRFAASAVKGHLLQVLDPAEEDLPFAGRVRFATVEEPVAVTIGRVESVRERYAARLAARRERLAAVAGRVGWTFATHRTDRFPISL